MAAGGRIQQKIYEDTTPVDLYDLDNAERLYVHTLSTTAWEVCTHTLALVCLLTLLQKITGIVPPITPIVPSSEYLSWL